MRTHALRQRRGKLVGTPFHPLDNDTHHWHISCHGQKLSCTRTLNAFLPTAPLLIRNTSPSISFSMALVLYTVSCYAELLFALQPVALLIHVQLIYHSPLKQ